MITASAWLTRLVLAHLLTDFILQPTAWVTDRQEKHFKSGKLYLHGFVTGLAAWILTGWQYWPVALAVLVTHTLIDGWKSYQKKTVAYFLADQCLHLLVILACWYLLFFKWEDVFSLWQQLNSQEGFWKKITAVVFLTSPAGILIGQLTKKWREQLAGADGLADAGKWIGMVERVIILLFVMQSQYSAIGLLVAAKGIIRFNEKDRPETKTEYLVIGTLLSIALAVIAGLLVK